MKKSEPRGERGKIIREEEVRTYAELDKRLKAVKEERDQMHDMLIAKFKDGYKSTEVGPFILVYSAFTQSNVDWRAWTEKLLKKMYPARWKRIVERAIEAQQTPREKLEVKINPNLGK